MAEHKETVTHKGITFRYESKIPEVIRPPSGRQNTMADPQLEPVEAIVIEENICKSRVRVPFNLIFRVDLSPEEYDLRKAVERVRGEARGLDDLFSELETMTNDDARRSR